MKNLLDYHDEIKASLSEKKPVVALESTVIAHGLPYPINLETALALEDIVRENGAIPAHICIKDGKIAIGLTKSELELLAKSGKNVKKLSTRDLSFALSQKILGATTVASTMRCADLAGIHVFATGGIGGVHRDGHISFDISADLTELARTNVAVICAGAKSILDIARTLEMLETLRVPVVGFGTNEFPAFYSEKSGHQVSLRLNAAKDIGNLLRTHLIMGDTGVLIANPIPKDEEIPFDLMENWIETALHNAAQNNISGHETTPYLLKQLFALSNGKTLSANIALLKSNAKLAATIAKTLAID